MRNLQVRSDSSPVFMCVRYFAAFFFSVSFLVPLCSIRFESIIWSQPNSFIEILCDLCALQKTRWPRLLLIALRNSTNENKFFHIELLKRWASFDKRYSDQNVRNLSCDRSSIISRLIVHRGSLYSFICMPCKHLQKCTKKEKTSERNKWLTIDGTAAQDDGGSVNVFLYIPIDN